MKTGIPGVYTAQKKDGSTYFRASVTYKNKHISLGSFPSSEEAHQAYLVSRRILNDKALSFDHYEKKSPLPFDKWVSLLNFRDNGLYISTPIYVRRNFFQYYLSPSVILKFDIDDLFYYSSHRIMKRGGHLFVADYGMQVSIISRYGIKSHAVCGRDYRFVNGDSTDFRYENIEILNRYYGVFQTQKHGRTLYKASIHVRGNYVIGVYATEEEAAIAYNKSVDFLKKAGVNKQYALNYIEGLSPAVYADIYSRIPISSKIISYKPMD